MNKNLTAKAALLAAFACIAAVAEDSPPFRWDLWAEIVVQDGGRMKPLDTLARESITQLTTSGKPKAGNPYLTNFGDVLDWKLPDQLISMLSAKTKASWSAWQAEAVADVESLRSQAKTLRAAIQLQEAKYVADHSSQPTFVELCEFIRSEAFISRHGDGAAKKLGELESIEKKIAAFDRFASEFIVEINELVSNAGFAATLGAKNAPDASPAGELERFRTNRLLLQSTFPQTFRPLRLAEAPLEGFELRKYAALEMYVRMLLSWQGWDTVRTVEQLQSAGPNADDAYWGFHKPDAWDSAPLISARYEKIVPILKPETKTSVSIRGIAGNPAFRNWALELIRKRSTAKDDLSTAEEKALAVIQDYQLFMNIRLGLNMICGPNQSTRSQDWAPLFALMTITPEQIESYGASAADIQELKDGFHAARKGLLANDAAGFNAGSRKFAEALQRLGKGSHIYPSKASVAREIHYNRFQPFLWTTAAGALATVLILVSLGTRSKAPYALGYAALLASMGAMAYGTTLRILIAGRPPVTNMYETIMWSSFVASSLAVAMGMIYRRHRVIPLTAAVVLTLSTLLANYMPLDMGKSITPLQPVLRSNYWLIVHVMTIVASYGAFMLAWGLGNVGLGFYLFGKRDSASIKPIVLFCYRSIQLGVLLLAAGTILGGWWAAESWGRFWGWDPKEVWALIALIGYLIILHCRFIGWVKQFGMLAGSVLAFTGVVMAWYGVNFVLGAGLHAYAFGSGGLPYVAACVVANWVFVGAAAAAYFAGRKIANISPDAPLKTAEMEEPEEEMALSTNR